MQLRSFPRKREPDQQLRDFALGPLRRDERVVMSRIAYVNGRYLPRAQAMVSVEDRGFQFADGVYEVCEVREGRLVDERRHMARLDRSLDANCASRARCRRRRSSSCCTRRSAATACATASSICRSPAAWRGAILRFRRPARRPTVVVTARSNDLARLERLAAEGVAVVTVPDIRWGRVDIKSVALLPNVLAKQAAREQGAREAWLVDAARPRHRRRFVECLDRHAATARWSPARSAATSCPASPARW